MNKAIKKMMIAGLACVALCGTTLAAPHGGNGGRAPQKAPVHQKAPAPKAPNRGHTPAPAHHQANHHAPAPAPHRAPQPPPPPPPAHHEHHGAGLALGATIVGGIVGGIIGAICN